MAVQVRSNNIDKFRHLISVLPRHFRASEAGLQHTTGSGNAIRDAIAYCLKRPKDVHQVEFIGAVAVASNAVVRSGQLDEGHFCEALSRELQRVRQLPLTSFTVCTRVNFRPLRARIKARLLDQEFVFLQKVPRKLLDWQEPSEVLEAGGVLTATGSFRSVLPAGAALSGHLERLVSYLNFSHASLSGMVFPESARALFRLGPIFSVYNEAKKVFEETHWINTYFDQSAWHFGGNKAAKFEASRKELRWINRHSTRNPLIEDVAECVVRLNNGWMEAETSRSLTSVWSGFEHLLSRNSDGSRGTYDSIAKRAGKFDADHKTRDILIRSLSAYRNEVIHGKAESGQEWLGAELYRECSRYLTWLLRWSMHNGWRFKSKDEFLEWADIPKEKERLLNRRRLHNLAYTFWHSRKNQT